MGRHFTINRDADGVRERDVVAPRRLEPEPGFVIEELWRGHASGPDVQCAATEIEFAPEPDAGGAAFRTVTFPPSLKPHVHRTDTTDLVAVMDGAPTLVLREGETLTLERGDTVVLCGAEHGWMNESDRPAKIAVLLLSARME